MIVEAVLSSGADRHPDITFITNRVQSEMKRAGLRGPKSMGSYLAPKAWAELLGPNTRMLKVSFGRLIATYYSQLQRKYGCRTVKHWYVFYSFDIDDINMYILHVASPPRSHVSCQYAIFHRNS